MERSTGSSSRILGFVINHIALPPKLPGRREDDLSLVDDNLARRLHDASRVLRDQTHEEQSQLWDTLCSIIQTCRKLNSGRKLENSSLLNEFSRLQRGYPLILQVTEQNAGLIIRREYESLALPCPAFKDD
jgi:hypothetical protein